MNFHKITVAGGGVLGSQIAFQTAFKGFLVVLYDISDEMIKADKNRIKYLPLLYKKTIQASDADLNSALKRLTYTTDLKKAVSDADILIEAVPENIKIKNNFYHQVGSLAPKKTIFASNSSTLLPSQLAPASSRPEKFINFHFSTHVLANNTAEIMGSSQTDPAIKDQMIQFARKIGMVPINLKKEQPGYIFNSLQIPLEIAALRLWARNVADPQTIDKTWMLATGSPIGPFINIDEVGLKTVYNISAPIAKKAHNSTAPIIMKRLKQMIGQGKTGASSGEGFYHYPNPAFKDPKFLKP